MSEECTHDCSTCGAACSQKKTDMLERLNELSSVGKAIAVISGKGGVGKSLVTSLLAVNARRRELRTAILDADITGPSIPQAFGIHERAEGDGRFIYPRKTKTGIEIMSLNLLLENESDAVVWRGPVIAGAVKQFWTDVAWNEIDQMYIDMPPGTGDVPLTVFQSIPVDGVIVVTTPQDLVSLIVEKAVKMARLMNIPILGIVENMSFFRCPDCGKNHEIFGKSRIAETAKKFDIPVYARLPIDPRLTSMADRGGIELYEGDWLDELSDAVEKAPNKKQG